MRRRRVPSLPPAQSACPVRLPSPPAQSACPVRASPQVATAEDDLAAGQQQLAEVQEEAHAKVEMAQKAVAKASAEAAKAAAVFQTALMEKEEEVRAQRAGPGPPLALPAHTPVRARAPALEPHPAATAGSQRRVRGGGGSARRDGGARGAAGETGEGALCRALRGDLPPDARHRAARRLVGGAEAK